MANNLQKRELFRDLEKIAFESLRKGLILIHERFVMQHATSKNAARTFKESGLLLLVLEGQEYQFPHLTFHEYFAGRYIARILKQSRLDEKTRVLDFIRRGKYDEKHNLTLTFAMHAFAEGRSKQALEELLSIMDEKPVEVLGIRHIFLRMRVLEATLEEAEAEEEIEVIAKDEQAIEIAEKARQILESTIDHVLIREIMVKEIQQLPCILKEFSKLLDETVNGIMYMLACSQHLEWKEMAKITDILKLAKHSPKHSHKVIRFILQLAKHVDSWCDKDECIRRFKWVAAYVSHNAEKLLPTITKGCGDENQRVNEAAKEAIPQIVAAAPHFAKQLLPEMTKKCDDEDWFVCVAAIEVIGRIVAAAPHFAKELLPVMVKKCEDEDEFLRLLAIEAIGQIVAEAPHFTKELLPVMTKKCDDDHNSVRATAMEVVDKIVAASPHFAKELFPVMIKRCDDEDWSIREAAIEAIGQIVAVDPQHAGELMPTMATGCDDEDDEVRYAARRALERVSAEEAISSVISSPSNNKGGFLFFFVQNSFTLDPPAKSKTVPFILHTTSSQTIGKWDKEAIDVFIEKLRQECDEEFPGLLENIGIKE